MASNRYGKKAVWESCAIRQVLFSPPEYPTLSRRHHSFHENFFLLLVLDKSPSYLPACNTLCLQLLVCVLLLLFVSPKFIMLEENLIAKSLTSDENHRSGDRAAASIHRVGFINLMTRDLCNNKRIFFISSIVNLKCEILRFGNNRSGFIWPFIM